jgi:hypothetical protein
MDKRLAKRHKRQVARERGRLRLSEPDLRTPEQIKIAREASRPADPSSPFPRSSSAAVNIPSKITENEVS